MATILEEDGFEFVIHSNEPHFEPPHIHVFKAGEEVKIKLGDEKELPEIARIWMRDKDAAKALAIVAGRQSFFLGAWKAWRIRHGKVETK